MKKSIFVITFFIQFNLFAQDQVRIMYYNILNFPSTTPERVDTLKKIVQYSLPDLFLVNELQSNTGATSILNNALNQNGITYYQKAAFINGPDTDNMLFYNANKFGLISQQKIATVLRDINEYVLYYKDPNISALSDTIYFYMYSMHLKAGITETAQRNIESTTMRNFLNSKTNIENVFLGGDFNFYNSNEPGFSTLKNSTILELKDPIFSNGNWHNNISYAYLHTQSTRTANLGDGAYGGMDDRFDIIFTSNDVLTGTHGIKYINNSYTALGQDGNRFNQSIISPTNTAVPQNIANALMYMSDHLPVVMDVDVDYLTNSIDVNEQLILNLTYHKALNQFQLNSTLNNFNFKLFNINGQELINLPEIDGNIIDLMIQLDKGIYVWTIDTESTSFSNKIIID